MLPLLLIAPTSEVYFRWIEPPRTIFDHVGEPVRYVRVEGLSDDGKVAAGTWTDNGHSSFRWTEEGGARSLPWDRERMGYGHHSANALSGDGRTVGGNAIWTQPGTPLYKLTRKTFLEMHELGLARNSIRVTALSTKGDSFAGEVTKPYIDIQGQPDSRSVAFVWRKGLGHRLVRDLYTVTGISSDGKRAVGSSFSGIRRGLGPAVFTWPATVKYLPLPEGSSLRGTPRISADGLTVVCSVEWTSSEGELRGVVWQKGRIDKVLPANVTATSVSPDGSVIVGNRIQEGGYLCLRKGTFRLLEEIVPEAESLAGSKLKWISAVSVQKRTITVTGVGNGGAFVLRFPRSRLTR